MEKTLTFDFKKKEHIELAIEDDIVLHLVQVENSYCILYFTKGNTSEVIRPADIVIYESIFNDKHIISHPKPVTKYYYLNWTENYLVKYKSEVILNMYNSRVWEIDVSLPNFP